MRRKKLTSGAVGRTAFVPGVVFRTMLKATIPIVSATVVPACLAIHAYNYDAGQQSPDASRDQIPDVGETGPSSDAADAKRSDGANDEDGSIGGTDGSNGH